MIAWVRSRACRANRAALVEFAAQRVVGPDIRRALDHVERCRGCERDLAATALVVHALGRLHDQRSRVELPPDGWSRMRARLVTPRRQPSLLMSCLPGVALTVLLVIAVGNLPATNGAPALVDDGSAAFLRHTSIDATGTVQREIARPAVRVVTRPTMHTQDRARPPALVAGPQAMDSAATVAAPAPVEPVSGPGDSTSSDAQMTWR